MDHIEHINFEYSLKNMSIPTHSAYKLLLTEKIEKTHFFLEGINNHEIPLIISN